MTPYGNKIIVRKENIIDKNESSIFAVSGSEAGEGAGEDDFIEMNEDDIQEAMQVDADYDKAMELYLKKVRSARGYNTREPSDYISSGNERWKTDA